MGVELSDVFVTLKDRGSWTRARTQDDLVEVLAASLSEMPGMKLVFTQPIEMRANEMIAGVRTDLGVKVFGDDLDLLRLKAREVEAVLKRIPGTADVFTEQVTGQPVLEIAVDRAAAGRHAIPVDEALSAVELLGGIEVGALQDGQRRFPVAVAVDEPYRKDAEAVGRILVSAASGDQVPLSTVTRIRSTEGPSTVQREWGKRRVVVQANVRDVRPRMASSTKQASQSRMPSCATRNGRRHLRLFEFFRTYPAMPDFGVMADMPSSPDIPSSPISCKENGMSKAHGRGQETGVRPAKQTGDLNTCVATNPGAGSG